LPAILIIEGKKNYFPTYLPIGKIFESERRNTRYLNLGLTLARFRTSNHKLSIIETARWNSIHKRQRNCRLGGIEIGDEYQYIMEF
jgi:hypothetical protein